MNWLKKNIDKLSAKLNGGDTTGGDEPQAKMPPEKKSYTSDISFDNIEELKELTVGAITKSVKMLGYGNTVVSGLNFHSKFSESAVENVGIVSLIKDAEFIKRIKRDFRSKGIRYRDNLDMSMIHASDKLNSITKINDSIGVEVLTPTEALKKQKAKIVATEGITWEQEYVLEPTGKQYFIGRCKDPKIENGPKIHNDIAFIGQEEVDDPKYKINSYVSRSHAVIIFDKNIGAYKLFRSKFLHNPSHKLKVYNVNLSDYKEVNLNQSVVPHVLREGDMITLNDKAVLAFSLTEEGAE